MSNAGTQRPGSGEYLSFLADVALVVAQRVEPWRARIAEAIARWEGEGYRVGVLQRAMQLPGEPDVDGLLATFEAAAGHLAYLAQQAAAVDPALAADEAFRDPERIAEAEALLDRAHADAQPPAGPDAALRRDLFEASACNDAAVKAADEVVAAPGTRHNPLVLHGAAGVGKTHLANALALDLARASGGAVQPSCVSGAQFAEEYVSALQSGTLERWRARYRAASALVVDGVDAVSGKERTQQELTALLEALGAARRQVIVTMTAAPSESRTLDPALRAWLERGTAVKLRAPDRPLRERLYARAFAAARVAPDSELLRFLAERPVAGAREVLATASRLVAAAEVAGVPLSMRVARAELGATARGPALAPAALPSADPFFLDEEKVIWDWPDVGGRVSEELH